MSSRLKSLPLCRAIELLAYIVLAVQFVSGYRAARAENGNGKTQIPILQLEQKEVQVGDYEVLIGPDCLRADCRTMGFTLLSRAPDWKVFIYRQKPGIYYDCSLKSFCERNNFFSAILPSGHLASLPVPKEQKIEWRGLPAYVWRWQSLRRTTDPFNWLSGKNRVSTSGPTTTTCIATENCGRPQAAKLLNSLYGMPASEYLPLSFVHSSRSSTETKLLTRRWKRISVSSELFQMPANLQRMSRMDQVLISSGDYQGIADIMEDLGVGAKKNGQTQRR